MPGNTEHVTYSARTWVGWLSNFPLFGNAERCPGPGGRGIRRQGQVPEAM
jgi:hypothetical protein